MILDGTYPVGARITEVDAAAVLAMSRTPVREALRALAADGLVSPTGRGVVVAAMEPGALHDAYEVRAALEALTAELAAARQRDGRIAPADLASLRRDAIATAEATAAGRLSEAVVHNRQFHRRIAELADNPVASSVLERLWDRIEVSTRHGLQPHGPYSYINAQHEQLLAAIVEGRPDRAGELARAHALDTRAATGTQDQQSNHQGG
jgi:DNA-binding GntR family transcriptional regulator